MLKTLMSEERRSKVERKEETERGYSETETLAIASKQVHRDLEALLTDMVAGHDENPARR